MNKTRQWAIFTLIAALVVFAGGYKLLVSPQRSNASQLNDQVTSEQSSTASLRDTLEQLESEKKNLPEQQKILESIATKIPADVDESTLIRQLQNAESSSGVDMTSVSPSTPTAVDPTAATPTTGAPTTSTATSGGSLSLYQMPLSIAITGSYFNAEMYLHTLEQLPRAMLVTGFTITPNGPTATSTSTSTSTPTGTAADQVTMQINAEVFLSPAAAPAATVPSTGTGASTSSVPASSTN